MKFSKAGATLPPECNTEPLAGFQSVNFRLKTATSALISISSLLACSTDFGLASPYNCRSQFLKWNLPLYLFCWFCFSREPWLTQACCWSHCYRQLWLIIRKPLTFVCWEFTPEVLKFISGFSPQWLRLHLGLLPPWHFWVVVRIWWEGSCWCLLASEKLRGPMLWAAAEASRNHPAQPSPRSGGDGY